MKYERFEDLPVWLAAADLAERVYRLTRAGFFAPPGDLGDQLRRAALSVSNNVAEGFERGSTAELLAFLYYARGSAGEVRSMLRVADRMLTSEISDLKSQISDLKSQICVPESEISNLKSQISDLIPLAESCSRQLRGWADSLQNSDIKGQRHLTDQSRAVYDARRRADDFQARLAEMNRQNLDRRTGQARGSRPDSPPSPGN